jgi:hypothetical protein
MMLREIITPSEPSFTMRLPEEMVGKTVEVIAFEINEQKPVPDKVQRLMEIEDLTKTTLVDLSAFKFNRDQANNYDE